jgi:hypothetical protein
MTDEELGRGNRMEIAAAESRERAEATNAQNDEVNTQ